MDIDERFLSPIAAVKPIDEGFLVEYWGRDDIEKYLDGVDHVKVNAPTGVGYIVRSRRGLDKFLKKANPDVRDDFYTALLREAYKLGNMSSITSD